jgi:hypothetical protein
VRLLPMLFGRAAPFDLAAADHFATSVVLQSGHTNRESRNRLSHLGQ